MVGSPQYERIVILRNPYCTDPRRAGFLATQLFNTKRDHGLGVTMLITEPGLPETTELLQSETTEGDIIAVAGGDGTISQVMRGLVEAGKKNPLLTLAAGNADDMAHMLHQARLLKDPVQLLAQGKVKPLRPISINMTENGYSKEQLAFAYFGIGPSAMTGHTVNRPEVRERLNKTEGETLGTLRRLAAEANIAISTLQGSPYFTLVTAEGEREAIEVSIIRERMAKQLRVPNKFLENRAALVELTRPTVLAMAQGIGRPAVGRGAWLEDGQTKGFAITGAELDSEGELLAQADGETINFPLGTNFLFKISERAVNVITTKPI